jgi:replicative DNA helicase
MISISRRVSGDCHLHQEDAHQLLDKAQQSFFSLAQEKAAQGMVPVSTLMHSALSTLERLNESSKYVTGIATGFREFDSLTSGLQPANLIIVAGRPGMGKTSFCLNVAEHVALHEKKCVVFFSLEMSDQEMGLRLLCSRAKINIRNVRKGFLSRAGWPGITSLAHEIADAPLYFDFSTSPSILDIRSSSRRWAYDMKQKGTPLELILVDYLQLLRGDRGSENRQQEIAGISQSLKAMARELNIPVIALSQLNRRPEDRGRDGGRPQLSDLRESGSLEQDSDLVAAIVREDKYKPEDPDLKGKAKLCILKQRNGPIGDIHLNFLEEYTRFVDPAPENESEPF